MKIQCSCGAKYELEITPDMAEGPVQFVCAACGVDASAYVTGLVRQQLGAPAAAGPVGQPGAAVAARPAVRLRVPTAETDQAPTAPEGESKARYCSRHPGELVVEQCCVCGKPICPKCMALFGYVCGPHCKAKAETKGLAVPQYAGLKSAVEARFWRKTGLIASAIALVVVAALGFWFWFAWIGSVPRVVFSLRFAEPAYSGQSAFAGQSQLIFLHGGLLARHDLKTKTEIWSRPLLDERELEAAAAKEIKEMQAANEQTRQTDPDHVARIPSPDRLKLSLEQAAAEALELRVQGTNIWIISPGKLVRYDWDTGKPAKEMPLPAGAAGFIARGDELLLLEQSDNGGPCVTHFNLATCESRTETLGGRLLTNASDGSAAPGRRGSGLAGMPVGLPGKDAGKAMDPATVARQAQHMGLPARIALPVVLANSRNQERAVAEMSDASAKPPSGPVLPREAVSYVPTKDGFLQFSVRLVERKIVARSAMKAPPTKSVLDGHLTTEKTTDLANEILNDMQRERGGGIVEEDESRYLVKLQPPEGKEGWSEEVIGPPALFPLVTVDVVAANKSIVVLDNQHRKLWQRDLSYNVPGGPGAWDSENRRYGQGPCVEHKGGLYVFDQGELTAFDLATGNVRWRLPSIGIAGMFFDDQDMIYINSTTAGLDSLKYSRQIDISQNLHPVIFKLDARTGRMFWREQPGAMLSYVSGKFMYLVQSYMPEEDDPDGPAPVETGFEARPYLRIKRLNPRTGHEMWEHFQERAPLDVQFDKNAIRLVFKKEVQVLRFVSF